MAKFMIKMINSPIIIEDGQWTNVDQIFDDYQVTEDDRPYCKIILGYYIYESYQGDSFVLFLDSRDNKLYEVNGSHCSCYGLEDQWKPELVDLESLSHRIDNGSFGKDYDDNNTFGKELKEIIDQLKSY